MKDNFIKFSQNAIFVITIAVALSSPLFFLPLTAEFFEFNKFTFLLFATIAGAILWGLRMVLQKKFAFTRTPLDIPMILLLLVFFIAAISSIDQRIAIFGTPQRPWPSFVSLLTLTVFYFVTASNITSKKRIDSILYALSGGTVAAAIISTISYFGLYAPLDFLKYRSFNTLGSANSLALLEAVVVPMLISWVIFSKNKIVRSISGVGALILIASLILINFMPAFLTLLIGLLVVGAVVLKQNKISKPAQITVGVVSLLTLLLIVVRYVPQIASSTLVTLIMDKGQNQTPAQLVDTPKAINLDQRVAWDIATSTIGKKPLFGTGPGTYLFAYTQLKPRSINTTDSWRIRFDKSSSDATELIATTGLIGVLVFLFFIATIVRFVWFLLFKTNESTIYLPAAAAIVAFVASQFFATSSISTAAPFFMLLAAIVTIAKSLDEKHIHEMIIEVATLRNSLSWLPAGGKKLAGLKATTSSRGVNKSQLLPYIFLALVLAVSFFGVNSQVNAWQGEYNYHQALLASAKNDGGNTIKYLQLAINANPYVDTYHRELSAVALNAAITLSSKKDLKDEEKQLISQLAQVAIDQGKVASGYQILPLRVPGISSANAANWETIAAAYQALIGQLQGSDVNAVNALAQASALDPENPILHERLGALYLRLKNVDSAQRKFEDSTVTKNDYGPAHWDLAKVLIDKKGDVLRIAQELTLAKRFLPQNDPAMDEINKLLGDYNKQVEELQKQQNQAAAQANPNASPPPAGGPSASPSPSASPNASPTPSPLGIPSTKPAPTPGL